MSDEGFLRIGELARRTGVTPEVLRAWESRYGLLKPSRSAGGFRLYSEADERRVRRTTALIADGLSAAEAARRALEAAPEPEPAEEAFGPERIEDLEAAIDAFDEGAAHRALDRLLATFSVETVLREAILPFLRRLGERWASGEVSVAQEHFASNLLRGRLLGLARGWGSGAGPLVVLACPPGEEHELALIAFGISAWRLGWRVAYLGANTPFDEIERTAREQRPALVVLAFSDRKLLRRHAERIEALASAGPVAIGGHVDRAAAERLGARVFEGDPVEAARSLVPTSGG